MSLTPPIMPYIPPTNSIPDEKPTTTPPPVRPQTENIFMRIYHYFFRPKTLDERVENLQKQIDSITRNTGLSPSEKIDLLAKANEKLEAIQKEIESNKISAKPLESLNETVKGLAKRIHTMLYRADADRHLSKFQERCKNSKIITPEIIQTLKFLAESQNSRITLPLIITCIDSWNEIKHSPEPPWGALTQLLQLIKENKHQLLDEAHLKVQAPDFRALIDAQFDKAYITLLKAFISQTIEDPRETVGPTDMRFRLSHLQMNHLEGLNTVLGPSNAQDLKDIAALVKKVEGRVEREMRTYMVAEFDKMAANHVISPTVNSALKIAWETPSTQFMLEHVVRQYAKYASEAGASGYNFLREDLRVILDSIVDAKKEWLDKAAKRGELMSQRTAIDALFNPAMLEMAKIMTNEVTQFRESVLKEYETDVVIRVRSPGLPEYIKDNVLQHVREQMAFLDTLAGPPSEEYKTILTFIKQKEIEDAINRLIDQFDPEKSISQETIQAFRSSFEEEAVLMDALELIGFYTYKEKLSKTDHSWLLAILDKGKVSLLANAKKVRSKDFEKLIEAQFERARFEVNTRVPFEVTLYDRVKECVEKCVAAHQKETFVVNSAAEMVLGKEVELEPKTIVGPNKETISVPHQFLKDLNRSNYSFDGKPLFDRGDRPKDQEFQIARKLRNDLYHIFGPKVQIALNNIGAIAHQGILADQTKKLHEALLPLGCYPSNQQDKGTVHFDFRYNDKGDVDVVASTILAIKSNEDQATVGYIKITSTVHMTKAALETQYYPENPKNPSPVDGIDLEYVYSKVVENPAKL